MVIRIWDGVRRRPVWAVVVVAVLLRAAAAIVLGNRVESLPGIADQISYHTLAVRVLSGHGFTFGRGWWPATPAGEPTAHWSYLYTLYLTGLYQLAGVRPLLPRLVQAVLVGALQPWLAFLLGERLFGRRAGLFSAGFTAVYIYFVYYAAALMTEAFYITGILASLVLAVRLADSADAPPRRLLGIGGLLGLCLGATVLLRQVYGLFLPFLFLWVLLAARRRALLPLGLAGLVLVALIAPVTWFNYQQFERFVLLNTNAGYAFFWGNHPVYGDEFVPILAEPGAYQALIPPELLFLDEAALDQALLRRGVGFALEDPGRYLRLSLSRIPVFFDFLPSAESGWISNLARVGSFGLFLPLMLWGLWRGFPRSLDSPGALLLLFAGVYTALHLLTWALVRYRLPVDAVLLIFAGRGAMDLIRKLRRQPRA